MTRTRRELLLAIGATLVAATAPVRAQAPRSPLPVVASFSILGDLGRVSN